MELVYYLPCTISLPEADHLLHYGRSSSSIQDRGWRWSLPDVGAAQHTSLLIGRWDAHWTLVWPQRNARGCSRCNSVHSAHCPACWCSRYMWNDLKRTILTFYYPEQLQTYLQKYHLQSVGESHQKILVYSQNSNLEVLDPF